jgi:hypothetical protein
MSLAPITCAADLPLFPNRNNRKALLQEHRNNEHKNGERISIGHYAKRIVKIARNSPDQGCRLYLSFLPFLLTSLPPFSQLRLPLLLLVSGWLK